MFFHAFFCILPQIVKLIGKYDHKIIDYAITKTLTIFPKCDTIYLTILKCEPELITSVKVVKFGMKNLRCYYSASVNFRGSNDGTASLQFHM